MCDVDTDITPYEDTWYSQSISIVSDGWSNIKHKPLINVLTVNSRYICLKLFQVRKTGAGIAKKFRDAAGSVGPSNVFQVVTDDAANCKAARKGN